MFLCKGFSLFDHGDILCLTLGIFFFRLVLSFLCSPLFDLGDFLFQTSAVLCLTLEIFFFRLVLSFLCSPLFDLGDFLFQTCPLIPLQSDHDPDNGRKILTCYLLPQLGEDDGPSDSGKLVRLKGLHQILSSLQH